MVLYRNTGGKASFFAARTVILSIMIALFLTACPRPLPEVKTAKYTSPTPGTVWQPDAKQAAKPIPEHELPGIPEELDPTARRLNLANLVDIALRNNPETKYAWAEARTSAADWARTRSKYYPYIDGSAEGAAGKIPLTMGGSSYGDVGIGLDYLLLDFGARGARTRAARQALLAANWTHNQSIQDVLRDVPQAYYTYIGDKAQVRATVRSLEEAETSLASTRARKKAGVSTIADVLLARSNAEQVRLDLVSNRGAVKISRGNLATAVGLPANTTFEVEDGPKTPDFKKFKKSVDDLISVARERRADLNASMASVRQMEEKLLEAKAKPFPTLTGTGNAQWMGTRNNTDTAYYGGLSLSIPIFHGFDMENAVRSARAELEAAQASFRIQEETVIQDVWNAYYNFNTASEKLVAAGTLLTSSTQSFDVSSGRYKAGAANIVELLDAQSQLAEARSEVVNARMDLYNSYAELIHAVGMELSETTSTNGTPELVYEKEVAP